MKDRCIIAVSEAVGRKITKAEADTIEARILRSLRRAAAADPSAFRNMAAEERLKVAAKVAAGELKAEAELKKKRIVLAIQAHDRIMGYVDAMKAKGMDGVEALRRSLAVVNDNRSEGLPAETRIEAIRADAIRQLVDVFESVHPRIWGMFEDMDGVRALTKAIFGQKSGIPEIDEAAAQWLRVTSEMRQRFIDAGGKVGFLENWGLPQHHSQVKVRGAGMAKWMGDVYGKLDRSKYLTSDGRPMSDDELRGTLRVMWHTLATGGVSDMEPGQGPVTSMLANRRAVHRELHFKSPDDYLAYQRDYGERSLWGVMNSHVHGLARDIGMIEHFGPNPDQTFKTLLVKQMREEALMRPDAAQVYENKARRLSLLYDFMTGATAPIVSRRMALWFDNVRNWLVASRLGSAVITALTDEATVQLTARVNNLPAMELVRNELAALNPLNREDRLMAHRAGIALEQMTSHLNRWAQETLGSTWTNKMASSILRASGLEALDQARRQGFAVTMLSAIGRLTRKFGSLDELAPEDRRMLDAKGVTPTDWAFWRAAELENFGAGNGVLTPEAVQQIAIDKHPELRRAIEAERAQVAAARDQKFASIDRATLTDEEKASSKATWGRVYDEQIAAMPEKLRRDALLRLLGHALEEMDMAQIRPGMENRFMTGAMTQRGTWKGELTRSFFVFKSFPLAMITKHFARGMGMPTVGGRAAYLASMVAATTVLGAVSQTINDLLIGKDPRNYNPFVGKHGLKNWFAAFLKGGSLGIYGDFLFSQATQGTQTSPMGTLLGPMAGFVDDLYSATQGEMIKAAQGKPTNMGAKLVQILKANTPGANLWYAKAALDHLMFNQLQEYVNPGSLQKMQDRAQAEFGQQYWWNPHAQFDGLRAPNFGSMLGQ